LDAALSLVPEDPLAWLLSAALARRMGDLSRAEKDIAEAAKRAPDDASVALEAGNIAAMGGQVEAAKTAWQAAQRLQPNGPQGQAAARALAQFTPPPTPDAAPPKP
jgi:tetratricopeptide (TPR) repeat protein